MADQADSEKSRPLTVKARPTANELLVAIGVLVGAALGAAIAGPGFGALVLTGAAIAAALWFTFGATTPSAPTTPIAAPAQTAHAPVPKIGRVSFDRTRWRNAVDISLDQATVLAVAPAAVIIAALVLFFYSRNLRTNPPNLFSDEAMIGLQAAGAFNGDASFQFFRIFYTHFEIVEREIPC